MTQSMWGGAVFVLRESSFTVYFHMTSNFSNSDLLGVINICVEKTSGIFIILELDK